MKSKLLTILINKIELELEEATKALESTRSLARSGEFKAESKWDTRGIEAGYLAGAQERRSKELEGELNSLNSLLENIVIKDTVGIGSLIEVEDDKWYFITLSTGGHKILIDEKIIQVVSVKSPIALKLIAEEIESISIT